jgi:hypothetical protein
VRSATSPSDGNSLTFNPARLQSGIANLPPKQIHVYNNVVLGWAGESGLQVVEEIVYTLLKNEEQAKAAGQ